MCHEKQARQKNVQKKIKRHLKFKLDFALSRSSRDPRLYYHPSTRREKNVSLDASNSIAECEIIHSSEFSLNAYLISFSLTYIDYPATEIVIVLVYLPHCICTYVCTKSLFFHFKHRFIRLKCACEFCLRYGEITYFKALESVFT